MLRLTFKVHDNSSNAHLHIHMHGTVSVPKVQQGPTGYLFIDQTHKGCDFTRNCVYSHTLLFLLERLRINPGQIYNTAKVSMFYHIGAVQLIAVLFKVPSHAKNAPALNDWKGSSLVSLKWNVTICLQNCTYAATMNCETTHTQRKERKGKLQNKYRVKVATKPAHELLNKSKSLASQ